MSREAMKQALEALELYQSKSSVQMFDDTVKALRQALETEQEPVAWISDSPTKGNGKQLHWTKSEAWRWSSNITPLYAAPPPRREWVGLTDDEIDALSQARSLTDELMDCVDRLGSEADTVDPRVWQHLLVYAPKPEEEPVVWMYQDKSTHGVRFQKHMREFVDHGATYETPLYAAPPKREWQGLTEREVELIDEMIETQLLHAERCDHVANSTMAQKQKAWDLERVELLRKLKERNT